MSKYLILLAIALAVGWCFGQWHIDENFDNLTNLPTGWIVYDDGDGMMWRNLNNASHAHSGTRAAFVDNYLPNQNADWLITPQLNISAGDSLIFYTRAWVSTENLKVYVSTTGNAISNFTNQIMYLQNIGTTYQRVAFGLGSFAGQNIYIGFLWQCFTYGILVDDIRIGQPLIIQPELNLPETVTFFQGESLNLDFTPYVTCTDINTASLSVSGNINVNVVINGMSVSLSSDTFNGTETLIFTLLDGSSGLTASDSLQVIVLPPPTVDLAIVSVPSPRDFEYRLHAFTPSLIIKNTGAVLYNSVVGVTCSIVDSTGTEQYGSAVFQAVNLNPDDTQTLLFNQGFTPSFDGIYTAIFQLVIDDDNPANDTFSKDFEVVLRITQGGPDAFGYRFVDSNDEAGPVFSWVDISTTGTSTIMYGVNQWHGDDNFSEPIPIGFTFPFYGNAYTQMYVDINGEILFEDNNWYNEFPSLNWGSDGNMFNYVYPIPGYAQMPGLIAVYWDDLYADQGIGDIYFQSFGTSPDRYFVLQWNNLRFLAGSGGSPQLKFQLILFENGEILMQYHTTQTGQSGSVVPHQNGRSATVGIQNSAANIGLCYLREIVQNNTYIGVEPNGNLLHDGLAIRIFSGEDTQAPVLAHSAIGNTFNSAPTVKLNAIDFSPITSISLHYRIDDNWQTLNTYTQAGNDYFFQFPALPLGSTVQYYFSATDELNNTALLPQNAPDQYCSFKILPTAGANVLLAYSGRQDYQHIELPVYENLLNQLEIAYDKYNWEEYSEYDIPLQYQAVICYASVGSRSAGADTLSIALMQYLESGTEQNPKHLFFSSDGWAAAQHATPNSNPMKKLFNAYFRSYYAATGLGGGTNGLAGPEVFTYQDGSILCLNNSPIGTPDLEYQVYANSPDCIFRYEECPDWYADEVQFPDVGALNAFVFEDGPVGGQAYLYHGVCATTITLPIYKAFYFSFDFSQLTSATQRYELFHDLMDWFDVLPTSNPDNPIPVVRTGIRTCYPNPFNPQTTISYTLSEKSDLDLSIYNVKGQKVRTLVNAKSSSGEHSVAWDGKDDFGKPVSSSVYFVRMKTPKTTDSFKVLLLK